MASNAPNPSTSGEDAAVIDMGDRYLIATSDPITFATAEIGWYLVNVNANDLACLGATPRWLLLTMLLPEGCQPAQVEAWAEQVYAACRALVDVVWEECRAELVAYPSVAGQRRASRLEALAPGRTNIRFAPSAEMHRMSPM